MSNLCEDEESFVISFTTFLVEGERHLLVEAKFISPEENEEICFAFDLQSDARVV